MKNKKLWFKRKTYGWGWTPSTWQGWLVLVIYLVAVLAIFRDVETLAYANDYAVFSFVFQFIFINIVLIGVCYWKGEKPRWTWGVEDNGKIQIRCRALIVNDGKLLVVKHAEEFDYYALPGGKLDSGETPLGCIKREIKEELGVDVAEPKLAYVYRWKSKDSTDNLDFIFWIEDGKDFLDLTKNERSHAYEIFEMRWIDKGENINLLPKEIKNEFDEGFDFSDVKFI